MPAYTSRLGLYKPGGGSSGNINPDEVVDIDKINDNMDKIDANIGVAAVTSTTRPSAPFIDQIISEKDTGLLMRWDGTDWVRAVDERYKHAEFTFDRAVIGDGPANPFSIARDASRTNDQAFITPPAPVGTAGNTLTVTADGLYHIDWLAAVGALTTGITEIQISIPGFTLAQSSIPTGKNVLSAGGVFYLTAGTVVSFVLTKTTGGTANVNTRIRVTRLGRFS